MGGYLNHCSSECTAALQGSKELKQTNSQLKFIISNKKFMTFIEYLNTVDEVRDHISKLSLDELSDLSFEYYNIRQIILLQYIAKNLRKINKKPKYKKILKNKKESFIDDLDSLRPTNITIHTENHSVISNKKNKIILNTKNIARIKDSQGYDYGKYTNSCNVNKVKQSSLIHYKDNSITIDLNDLINNSNKSKYNFVKSNNKTYGEINFTNSIYKGYLKNQIPHCFGVLSINNQSVYKGEFNNGVLSGFGLYESCSFIEYEGEFIKGSFDGVGIEKWIDNKGNNIYIGDYKEGVRNGIGSYLWNDNSLYEGEFINGCFHGFGKYTYSDGSYYIGEWYKSKFNGYGELFTNRRNIYKGTFLKNKKDGFGLLLKDNELSISYWRNNNIHGLSKSILITENEVSNETFWVYINGVKKIRYESLEDALKMMKIEKEGVLFTYDVKSLLSLYDLLI